MRRILFQQTDFNLLPNPPAGFKYVGFDGPDFTIKEEDGQIDSSIGATGPQGPQGEQGEQGPQGPAGSGGTGSSDRLTSSNEAYNLEVILDSSGTLNVPLLLPVTFMAVCDGDHMIDAVGFTDDNWWIFEVEFAVNPNGEVETLINNIFPILTNPGYVSGYAFRFTEADHGIPGFNFDIQLDDVVFSGGVHWTANLTVTQPPIYPSTIESLGAIKLTSNSNSLVLGTLGDLTIPGTIKSGNSIDLKAADDVSISTNTTGITQSFTFDEAGKFTLPSGASIVESNFTGADGQNAVLAQYDGHTQVFTMQNGVGIQTYDSVTYSNWNFGSTGDLTLPLGGDILDSNGDSVLGIKGITISIDGTDTILEKRLETTETDGIVTVTNAVGSKITFTNTTLGMEAYSDPDGPNNTSLGRVLVGGGVVEILSSEENLGGDATTGILVGSGGIQMSTNDGVETKTITVGGGDIILPSGGDIKDYLGNSVLSGISLTEVTHSELLDLMNSFSLIPGRFYEITDFKTCYDQPDYDIYGNPITSGNYKEGSTHSIMVFATGTSSLSVDAWQPDFPKDKIKYDISWTQSEHTGGTAYGRITERIDEFNNRTDYDHREVYFKRYDYYLYDINNPQAGTVSVVNGVVTGVDTIFTNFSPGDVIALPYFSEEVFRIDTITSDTAMSLTGSVWDVTANDIKYYSANYIMNFGSPKKTNVDSESYNIRTFDGVTAFNNYIGDHANSYLQEGIGNFVLSNNVFLDGSYYNNRFGNNCYNNTFDDDCSNNTIGNFFCDNITDDDFDGNDIENYFQRNIITANFQRNSVGENFQDNIITVGSFYRNRINNQFENNKISGNDFQNNIIGNAFANNTINTLNDGFLKNIIGVGFNNNEIRGEFDSNTFGNGGNANKFYSNMYENKIGDYFNNNIIGLSTNYGGFSFYENHIGNDFYSNNIYRDFYQNRIFNYFVSNDIYNPFYRNEIGYQFDDNIVGDYLNIGVNDFYQNTCKSKVKGNLFFGYTTGNEFGEEFSYNILGTNIHRNIFGWGAIENNIGNNFEKNTIGSYFFNNNISNDFLSNTIGNEFSNNIISNNFAYNKIGDNFNDNNIQSDFGFGGSQVYGNKIGNYFQSNNIGEYFYSNTVKDLFTNNSVGHHFRFNDIQIHYLYNQNLQQGYNEIISFTDNTGLSPSIPGTDGVYIGLTCVSVNNGVNATFDVTVVSSAVINVSLNFHGYGYDLGSVLEIPYESFGGTAGLGIIITVGSVSATPAIYGNYNSTVFKNSNNQFRVSHYDGNDVLTITNLVPAP